MAGLILSFLRDLTNSNSAQAVSLASQPMPVGAGGRQYQTVPANTAAQAIGPTGGALGDDIDGIWIFPASLAAMGAVVVLDGAVAVWAFPAAQTLANLAPIFVPLNYKSVSGAWHVTTGASGAAQAFGRFT